MVLEMTLGGATMTPGGAKMATSIAQIALRGLWLGAPV